MDCKLMERWILLQASGELSDAKKKRLDRHAAACEECARFRRDSAELTARLRAEDPAGPSLAVIERIGGEARAFPGPTRIAFPAAIGRILACAAALALAAAGWLLLVPARQPSRVADVHALITMVSEEVRDVAAEHGTSNSEQDLRDLARRLLRAEGLWFDDATDGEAVLMPEGRPTTEPLSRSTPSFPAGRCG